MTQMLVLETANNPGSAASFPLLGAPPGRRSWLTALGSGVRDEYVMAGGDGQFEWGIGYPTADSPNTFTRETVLGGSLGPGVRVNFTGQVDVYSDFIPARVAPIDVVPRKTGLAAGTWSGSYALQEAALTIGATLLDIPAGTRKLMVTGLAYFQSNSTTTTVCAVAPQIYPSAGPAVWSPGAASVPLTTIAGVTTYAQVVAEEHYDPGAALGAGLKLGLVVYRGAAGDAILNRLEIRARFLSE